MSKPTAMWSVSTSNIKTGAIPTQWVGATETETRASCAGCALAPWAGNGCYAWNGNVRRGANSVRRANKRPTLEQTIERAPRGARAVRLGAIGDPSRIDRATLLADVDTARSAGLKVLGYTHHWAAEPRTGVLRGALLASCETLEQAAEAQARGWLVALAGPSTPPKGFIQCPHYARPDVQCNRCGLCDVPTLRRTGALGVTFPAHGALAKRLPLAS